MKIFLMLSLNFFFYYSLGEKCYRVGGRKEHERVSWSRALDKCRSYGAELVSIESQAEQGKDLHLVNVIF